MMNLLLRSITIKLPNFQIYHEGSALHFLHTDSALSLGLAVPGAARKKQVFWISELHFSSDDGARKLAIFGGDAKR